LKSSIERLKGKRALVTGATGGIGKAIVGAFVDVGIKVIAAGQNPQKLSELSGQFPGIIIERVNFKSAEEVFRLADASLKHFDGLDILVNNAGIGVTGNVTDMEIKDFDSTIDIDLRAPFILAKVIGKAMALAGSGHIINLGSGASYTPIAGMAAYCAAKYGLLGFSESLALELRNFGVKVTIIMPGSTATNFGGGNTDKRLKDKPGILLPEDVADTVMYILKQSGRAWSSQVNLRPLNPNKQPYF
jgi:3-oxoacyl-[acyl-carrier protein] reductase